jgi:hypothetical protein
MNTLSTNLTSQVPTEEQILQWLQLNRPITLKTLHQPLPGVQVLYDMEMAEQSEDSEWTTVGRRKVNSLWDFWRFGLDIVHLTLFNQPVRAAEPDSIQLVINRFASLHVEDEATESAVDKADIPAKDEWSFLFESPVPMLVDDASVVSATDTPLLTPRTPLVASTFEASMKQAIGGNSSDLFQTDRPLKAIIDLDIWSLSQVERHRLAKYVCSETKSQIECRAVAGLKQLVDEHAEAKAGYDNARHAVSGQGELADGRSAELLRAASKSLDVQLQVGSRGSR